MMLRRRSIGQEGTSAEFCDLSGRGLNTAQVERTLRVFDTAVAIDMSNNELELIPSTIPTDIAALDVSFNLLSTAHGIEHLQVLQELNLGFNRLVDVTILEFCPLLQRVNLSGNRLTSTRGLETLVHLENLDISDNLLESVDELRSLSMNQHLTHLTVRGNPIAHKASVDYRVLVLDMIPSVLILDDKKIRSSAKTKTTDPTMSSSSSSTATKSLSYSRIYDDKKQFVIRNQQTKRTPATRPPPILLGDPTVPTKYEGNTIFIQSPKATTITHDATAPYSLAAVSPRRIAVPQQPQVQPSAQTLSSTAVRLASPTASGGGPYMSLYDRLAAANGITPNKTPEAESSNQTSTDRQRPTSSQGKRPPSSQSRRDPKNATSQPQSAAPNSRPPSRGGQQTRADTPLSLQASQPRSQPAIQSRPIVENAPQSRPPSRGAPASRPDPLSHSQQRPATPATQTKAPTSPQPYSSHRPPAPCTPSTPPYYSSSPSPASSYPPVDPHAGGYGPPPVVPPPAPSNHLDPKQQNVLSVIQNLIHHKKQTLATLARQSSSTTNAATVYSS